jgi:hypothetical protein
MIDTDNSKRLTPSRYLVLGSTGYGGLDSVDWMEGELPNLVDYDIIIVDVPALSSDRLALIKLDRLKSIRNHLVRFIDSFGKLVAITNHKIIDKKEKRYPETISNYEWCPISIGTNTEQGKTIVIKQNLFKNYLPKLSDWDYYLYIPQACLSRELTDFYGSTSKTKYEIPCSPILENRYGQVLARSYRIEVYQERTRVGEFSSVKGYPSEPDILTGEIILLPRIKGMDHREAVSLVIQELTGIPQHTLSPEWADSLIVPGITDLLTQVEGKQSKIQKIEAEISKLRGTIDRLNDYKKLLYSTGHELEDIVARCFEELGGQIIPAKYSEEEFVLIYKGNEYLVEVKGSSKSISLQHLRQLSDYLLKYQEDTGKQCKGILFGNAWRSISPEDRNSKDTPEFPSNVVNRAEDWNIALVPSTKFFQVFMKFLENSKGEQILDAITTQKGIVNFQ